MADLQELIFAAPWWLPVLLGLVAVVLLWTGARRQQSGSESQEARRGGLKISYIVFGGLVIAALAVAMASDDPGAMSRWVWRTLGLGLGLVVIWILWGEKGDGRGLRIAGLAVVAVGGLVIVLSALVETDREAVQRQTREMIAAVDQHDWETVSDLLHPAASLTVLNAELVISPRELIVELGEAAAVQYGLRSARIRSIRLDQADSLITVHLDAFSEQEATPYPLPSSWQLDWQKTAEGWFLHRITLIQIGQHGGEDVARRVPSR